MTKYKEIYRYWVEFLFGYGNCHYEDFVFGSLLFTSVWCPCFILSIVNWYYSLKHQRVSWNICSDRRFNWDFIQAYVVWKHGWLYCSGHHHPSRFPIYDFHDIYDILRSHVKEKNTSIFLAKIQLHNHNTKVTAIMETLLQQRKKIQALEEECTLLCHDISIQIGKNDLQLLTLQYFISYIGEMKEQYTIN